MQTYYNMIDYDKIKEELSPDDIIKIIQHFIPDLNYEENRSNGCLIFPTICHNLFQEDGSKKLYYYFNTHLFHCYTHCGSFDIYELVKKMLELRDLPDDFTSVFNIISNFSEVFFEQAENEQSYKSISDKYLLGNNQDIIYKTYDPKVLACFQNYYPIEWIKDGISIPSMKKFNIKFSIVEDQIVIPHYNIDSQLIGIRVRNLDKYKIEKGGKYMPAKINGEFYTHPLMYNLYGININKDAIRKNHLALIAEGEKSVLIADGWFKDNNCVVATCGDKFNKFLIKQLVKIGATDIVICYDRMNHDKESREKYFNKLYVMCEKYSNYANFSFIFDRDELLDYKAAPFDSGVDVFEKLFNRRVLVK